MLCMQSVNKICLQKVLSGKSSGLAGNLGDIPSFHLQLFSFPDFLRNPGNKFDCVGASQAGWGSKYTYIA